MEYFEKITDTVAAKSRQGAAKAKEMAEIARLKSQISACKGVVEKNYMEIGKQFYEDNLKNDEAPYQKQRKAIRNAQRAIFELEEQIAALKR